MESQGKSGERFTVVRGGMRRPPRLLVVDFDASGVRDSLQFSPDEARALTHAHTTGIELAVATGKDERLVLPMLADVGLTATVLLDGAVGNDFERGHARAEHLVALCRERGIPLRDAAAIAVHPYDCPMLLEAGTAFALESAGYDACAASDAVFPARDQGGLAAAVDAVMRLRCGYQRDASSRSWLTGR